MSRNLTVTCVAQECTEPDEPHGCFQIVSELIEPMSPSIESEFDEFLAMPDSITVCSVSGDPVLVDDENRATEQTDGQTVVAQIPFSAVHNPPIKFKSNQRKVFIPGVEIKVSIVDNERSVTTHLLNPNLYTIRFDHDEFTWYVKKRYKHIQQLHQQLRIYRASLNIPFPTKTHRDKRNSFKNNVEPKKGKRKGALPRFPSKPEALVPFEQLPQRTKQIEDYLYNLLNMNIYRNHPETIHFLQVSHLSFIHGLGTKGKEGEVLKRTGSTQPGQAGCNFCGLLDNVICVRCNYFWSDIMCGAWRKRWFFVKESFFGYVRPKDGSIKCIILFDQGFEVSSGMYSTGLSNGLQIQTLTRQLVIKCWTRRKSKEWMAYLRDTAHHKARDFTQPNEHSSFVPVRTNIQACWYVDGAGYMSAVADALEAATEEIFIADWWLSPEIYMKRPILAGDFWRLDKILKRKANQGVKVFVLLYKEVELALGINSYYSKQRLLDEAENIKVLRHPDHAKLGVFLWAHHEKIVVVDQAYAFLGGIDLCYGRWDDARHRLTDLGSLSQNNALGRKKKTSSTPTNDYPHTFSSLVSSSNAIGVNIVPLAEEQLTTVTDSSNSLVEESDDFLIPTFSQENVKCNTPEMERKNPMDKLKTNVKTKTKDFIHKLSYANDYENTDKTIINHSEEATNPHVHIGKPQNSFVDVREATENLSGSAKLWLGKDYVNFIVKDFCNLDLPFIDLVDRNTTPRMPWHDIGVMVRGTSAKDVARHFIQRWNDTKLEKARINTVYPYLIPKSYNESEPSLNVNEVCTSVTCQVVRSVSSWSCGFLENETVEQSIHEAYVDTINRAQQYVYIENQFFITLAMESMSVRNQIGEALYKRIKRAHREQTPFRVYVVMPLLPGFEGEVGGATGTALHAVTHWNYQSISRSKDSIISRLYELGIKDPSEYISFYGLRTHSILHGEPITELIYVHSKLLIADDNLVICGSANINDRSMLGKRDSEIAVLIKDESYEQSLMNGEIYPSGKFAGSLRRQLFREHLGLLDEVPENIDISDPVADSFYKDIWMKTADDNTAIYEAVFHCIPTDKVETFTSLKTYQEEMPLLHTDPMAAKNKLEQIKGNLVRFPLNFLCNETLTPNASSVEGMMPTSLWT